MSIIHKSNTSMISKIKDKTYKLIIEDYTLYKNFWKDNIKNFDIIEKNNNNNKLIIIFKADEIISFKNLLKKKQNKLGYKQAETLFHYFKNSINSLEKDNYSNLLININDLLIVNPYLAIPNFIYINTKYFLPLNNNNIEINIPFMKNNVFLSPELINLTEIPSHINKKSIYYSIGVLISYAIDNTIYTKNINHHQDIIDNLDPILKTKLYYAVIRCLNKNPNDRFLLYI